jgi:hypothetical protein
MAVTVDPAEIGAAFRRSLAGATRSKRPFEHWLLRDAIAPATIKTVLDLPIPAPEYRPTQGKRETNNASRSYLTPATRACFPLWDALAGAFQAPETVRALESTCAAQLAGTALRIEYTQDIDGFWLEPHTDIAVKRITILLYLSETPDGGTDLFDGQFRPVGQAPAGPGRGLIFVPGSDTWHGFLPRPFPGVRRSLIINYVSDEWRARHELAFPDQPVG